MIFIYKNGSLFSYRFPSSYIRLQHNIQQRCRKQTGYIKKETYYCHTDSHKIISNNVIANRHLSQFMFFSYLIVLLWRSCIKYLIIIIINQYNYYNQYIIFVLCIKSVKTTTKFNCTISFGSVELHRRLCAIHDNTMMINFKYVKS